MVFPVVLLLAMLLAVPMHAAEIVLWPEGVPEPRVPAEPAEKVEKSGKDGISRQSFVSNPRLVVYDAPCTDPAKPRGAVIIVPGGGFNFLSNEHEGSDVCKWFNDRGIVSFLCLHRVPTGGMKQPNLGPVLDVQKAVLEVRQRASDHGIDPAKIALLGFSAGGQVSLVAATNKPTFVGGDAAARQGPGHERLAESRLGLAEVPRLLNGSARSARPGQAEPIQPARVAFPAHQAFPADIASDPGRDVDP